MLGMEETMKNETYRVDVLFGKAECRSWLESEMMPDGSMRLVGMGSRTDYDRDGKVVAHKCEPTGAVMYWAAPEPVLPWWQRIFA
jgi:hypothetical protein